MTPTSPYKSVQHLKRGSNKLENKCSASKNSKINCFWVKNYICSKINDHLIPNSTGFR